MTKKGIDLLYHVDVKTGSVSSMRDGLIRHEKMRLVELETGSPIDAMNELGSADETMAVMEAQREVNGIAVQVLLATASGAALYAI